MSLKPNCRKTPPAPKKPRKKRKGFSDQLPRIRVESGLNVMKKNQGAAKTFFTKVKEELDIIPAQARVLEYWQEKAVFEDHRPVEQQMHRRPTATAPTGQMHRQRATAGLYPNRQVCR